LYTSFKVKMDLGKGKDKNGQAQSSATKKCLFGRKRKEAKRGWHFINLVRLA